MLTLSTAVADLRGALDQAGASMGASASEPLVGQQDILRKANIALGVFQALELKHPFEPAIVQWREHMLEYSYTFLELQREAGIPEPIELYPLAPSMWVLSSTTQGLRPEAPGVTNSNLPIKSSPIKSTVGGTLQKWWSRGSSQVLSAFDRPGYCAARSC